jgi:nitrogen-specific signal transduction histidine kinase
MKDLSFDEKLNLLCDVILEQDERIRKLELRLCKFEKENPEMKRVPFWVNTNSVMSDFNMCNYEKVLVETLALAP